MPEENGNNKQIRNEIQRFKLVVVGDGACGKTSILTKFTVRRDLLIFIFTKLIRSAKPHNSKVSNQFLQNMIFYPGLPTILKVNSVKINTYDNVIVRSNFFRSFWGKSFGEKKLGLQSSEHHT